MEKRLVIATLDDLSTFVFDRVAMYLMYLYIVKHAPMLKCGAWVPEEPPAADSYG
jgi:hypothetical protein